MSKSIDIFMILKFIPKKQNGLSLIEIVVALSVLSIAFLGLIGSFPLGMLINKEAEYKSVAANLAQSKIEELIYTGYDNIAVGTIEAKTRISPNQSDYLYKFKRMTTVVYVDGNLNNSASDTGLKKISANVYYLNPINKVEKIFILNTLISKK